MNPGILIGRYINFPTPGWRNSLPADVGNRVHSLLPSGAMVHNLTTYGAPAPLGMWLFTWLNYIVAKMTFLALNTDVMTGPMSGCILPTFHRAGFKVAHVGTGDTPTNLVHTQAKQLWTAALATPAPNAITQAKAVNPYAHYTLTEISNATINGVAPDIFGYFEPNGSAYAVMIQRIPTLQSPLPVNAFTKRIVARKPTVMLNWSAFAPHRHRTHANVPEPDKTGTFKIGSTGLPVWSQ